MKNVSCEYYQLNDCNSTLQVQQRNFNFGLSSEGTCLFVAMNRERLFHCFFLHGVGLPVRDLFRDTV